MNIVTLPQLAQIISERAADHPRLLVGIAGAPASGKSTLAADLATRLGPHAAVLPMDGFHLDNEVLTQMGLFHRKGAPETFDANGFVDLLRKLRTTPSLPYPTFDRAADKTVPNGGEIDAATRIVLIEGNYLLLDIAPWSSLADVFDLTVRLDVDREDLEQRLIARWLDHGLTQPEALARAQGNDLPNADFVAQHARPADLVLRSA